MRPQSLRSLSPLFWMLGLGVWQLRTASAFNQCYYPDGSVPTDYLWEPCTGAQYSSCCVPSEGDVCQPSGLCYYPLEGDNGALYRGTCTDRTWDAPACNADICVTGYETTWNWATECDASGSTSWACGNITDGEHDTPTCPGSAKTQFVSFQTTTTTSSAGRYTPPPSIDTSLYSVVTNTYTTIITADVQTTTLTSTFESTSTSTLSLSSSTSSGAGSIAAASSTNTSAAGTKPDAKKVVLSTGIIAAIIVGPTLAVALVLAVYIFMRRRSKKNVGVRLSSSSHPPPNGPVGADQVNPYEMDVYESKNPPRVKHEYSPFDHAAPAGVHEANGFQEEKTWGRPAATEISGQELRSPRSPAPMYTESVIPVELDGTSSIRGRNEM